MYSVLELCVTLVVCLPLSFRCILKAPPPGSSTNESRLATEDETEYVYA